MIVGSRKLLRKNTLLRIAIGLLLIFSFPVFFYTERLYLLIEQASLWIRTHFGDFYLYLGLGCVLGLLLLAFSPLGKRKLGKTEDRPEYSLWAWSSMLYSAGMGAGVLLRAVQEPVYMLIHPPLETGTPAAVMALEYTFYQWGITAWAFYGLFAVIIGYYLFVRNKKVLVSAAVEDVFTGKAARYGIDILAIITTVFGLVGAVGLGTTQITGGLNHLSSYDFGMLTTIAMTLLIVGLAFISVWRGMDKGIKVISKLNIGITLGLLFFVFFQSDILHISRQFFRALYHYVVDFIPMSIAYGNYDPGSAFLTEWTYYYWAFWLAWAPFTGIFIARISKGRTLRQLLLGVLIIPSLGTFFWFSVFGDAAFMLIEDWGNYRGAFDNVFNATFVFLSQYPLYGITAVVTLFLLISFLVTSVDSAVFVLSMFTDDGKKNPTRKHRLIWSVFMAVFAVGIVVLGHANPNINVLIVLQKLLIVTSLPFAIFMVLITGVFLRELYLSRSTKQKS